MLTQAQVDAAKAWVPLIDWAGPLRRAGVEGGGGYRARFVGGCVDGRAFRVPSLAPTRLARHGEEYGRPGSFPQAQRAVTPPPGVFDSYEAGGVPPGGDVVTYTFVRTIRRAG